MSTVVFQAALGGQINLVGANTASTLNINVPAFAGTMASLLSVNNNGVTYVNSSGQPTTGSALTFDGTNFVTTGTASATKLIPTGGTATGNGMYLPASNQIAFSTNGTEGMRIDASSNLLINSGYGSVATAYGCRAWVNFNGVTTVSIRGSANVSSVTRASAGLYTINFTIAMPDVNYSAIGTCNFEYDIGLPLNTKTFATGSIGIETFRPYPYNTVVDVSTACVAIFR